MSHPDDFAALRAGWESSARQRPEATMYDVHRESTPATFGKSGEDFAGLCIEALPPADFPKILELGAGPGRVTRWLQEAGYDTIWTVDIAPTMVRWQTRLINEGILDPDIVHPIQGNGTDLAGRIGPLDGVYTSLVLMHNTRPNVEAIFDHLRTLPAPPRRVAFQLPVYSKPIEPDPPRWNYVAQWTRDEVIALAGRTGWAATTVWDNPGTYDSRRKAETIGPNHWALHVFDIA